MASAAFKTSFSSAKIGVESSRLKDNERPWDEQGGSQPRWAGPAPNLNGIYADLQKARASGAQTARGHYREGWNTSRAHQSGSQTHRKRSTQHDLNKDVDRIIRPDTGMSQRSDKDRYGFNGKFMPREPSSLSRPVPNWTEKIVAPVDKWQARPRTSREQGCNLEKKIPGYSGFYAGKKCRDARGVVLKDTPDDLQYQLDILARNMRRFSPLPNDPTPSHGYQRDLHPDIPVQNEALKKNFNMKKNQWSKWTEMDLLAGDVMKRGIKLKKEDDYPGRR